KFQTFPIGGARHFQALWLLLKGFYIFINYFPEKEGFLNRTVV
ncbi:unnamed protein product, partial [marine sediment metagenome]